MKLLSLSGARGGKLISVNNFSAQEHASPKNRHVLNFRVMAVRDKAVNVFIKKYILISGYLAFLEVKSIRKSPYLNVCLISLDNQWPR